MPQRAGQLRKISRRPLRIDSGNHRRMPSHRRGSVIRMAWARDEVLFRAQFRLIGLWSVHNRVSREQPDRSPPAVQQETFELVRSLVDEGLVVIGDRTEQGFVAWTLPVGDGLERIREQFAAELAGEEPGNFDQPWLQLTDAGRQAAETIPVDPDGEPPDRIVPQWDWPFARCGPRSIGLRHHRLDRARADRLASVRSQSGSSRSRWCNSASLELIADLVRRRSGAGRLHRQRWRVDSCPG